ncbi:protein unc-13 homolog 4B-like [Ctenocephalides felis]|uniref:protein unc-13 homolog 4B-like n=1 Tax=Ctenocephalides felis TaxID=7515 RepID=UPI000E6E50E2|nr:protein unc-13 homolog 4B-like [Ctenocephalides felis]
MVLYVERDLIMSDLKKEVITEMESTITLDDLYEEVLFGILHNVGCSKNDVLLQEQEDQIEHLRQVFRISANKHELAMAKAMVKIAPEQRLNVEIVEAKDLLSKQQSRAPNAYVALYLESAPTERHYTGMKSGAFNPEWGEHISLPLGKNTQQDVLCLEVWDFEAVDNKSKKFGSLGKVKSLGKLMKEFSANNSTPKTEDLLIGTGKIPLKSIPMSGTTMLYSLDKPPKIKKQGVLKLRIAVGAQKEEQINYGPKDQDNFIQKHMELLKMLLLYEVETLKHSEWSGTWSPQSQAVLIQHRAQGGLSHTANALCEWSVYTRVHSTDRPLALELFNRLLKVLVKPLQQQSAGTQVLEKEEERMFWEGAVRILPGCFSIIKTMHRHDGYNQRLLKDLNEALPIVQTLACFRAPAGFELLPAKMYTWIKLTDGVDSIKDALNLAVRYGAQNWFKDLLEHQDEIPREPLASSSGFDNSEQLNGEEGLRKIIYLIQRVLKDLEEASKDYDKIFKEIANVSYTNILYKEYAKLLSERVKPEIDEYCANLQKVCELVKETVPNAMGTTLFELYLEIKRFVNLGNKFNENQSQNSKNDTKSNMTEVGNMARCHLWFTTGVTHWLDVASFKAKKIIEKAVEMDNFVQVTDDVHHSSSAVDTLAFFYQIKIFWDRLEWPDPEGCYTFVTKIIRDIYVCFVFYADCIRVKLNSDNPISSGKNICCQKWCVGINTIEYVQASLQKFVKELGTEKVLENLKSLGQGLCTLQPSDIDPNTDTTDDGATMSRHHEWFTAGVAHWLDIAAYKATGRIDKAVELDKFVPVTDDVKYSSSAVDSLAIFYQIKIFWEQLEWPDVEGSYTFVAKIVDDICRCCVFYADRVSDRLDSQECAPAGEPATSTTIGNDACSEKWCVAINNIDYVRRSLEPFVKELGVDGVLDRLADYRSPEEAERCRATLLAVIENNVDTVRNKILELIESLARKMAPALRRALAEGAELGSRCIGSTNGYSNGNTQTTECFAYTALLGRLENALATLHRALSSTNFSRARSALWAELSKALFELVQTSLEKRRPPSLYASLLETLDVLHESFGIGGGSSSCTSEPNSRCASPTPVQRARLDECREQEALDREQLEQMRELLRLHALETGDLIHRFHLDRLKEQESMQDTPYGILTVRCRFLSKWN